MTGPTPQAFITWKSILAFIDSYHTEHGYPPSTKEMMAHTGARSSSTIAHHVNYLIARKYVTREFHQARTTMITDKGKALLKPKKDENPK